MAGLALHGLLLAARAEPVLPVVFTWLGGSGDWSDAGQWDPEGIPDDGDTVIISAGTVSLTNRTAALAALAITNATLIASGWETCVEAATITIDGTVTHALQTATATNSAGEWVPDNRVWIICNNLTLKAGKTINVNGKGYTQSRGPGVTVGNRNVGASHGGLGTSGQSYALYGDPAGPLDPGSGGGGDVFVSAAGIGGGAVRIEASGTVLIFGTITADGTHGSNAGGGSGGSIWVSCRRLAGSGTLSARGGTTSNNGGGGGGGRVAVDYDPDAQATGDQPTVTVDAAGGKSSTYAHIFGMFGTLAFPDTIVFPTPVVAGSGEVVIPGFSDWSATALTVSNAWLRFRNLKTMTLAGALTVRDSDSRLDFINTENGDGAEIHCDSLTITNGGRFYIFSGITHSTDPAYSSLLSVTSKLTIATNAGLYLASHPTNGGSVAITVGQLHLQAGGLISADGTGFSYWHGPGRQPNTAQVQEGGGYGGGGGKYHQPPLYLNNTYGCSNAPVQPGSPGGGGSRGGGLIRLWVHGPARIDGLLSADALMSSSTDRGGGSGGGIWLRCHDLTGTGDMRARGYGGNRWGAGGGGGRIAVWYTYNRWNGTLEHPAAVQGGVDVDGGRHGQAGTIVWKGPPPGTQITIR